MRLHPGQFFLRDSKEFVRLNFRTWQRWVKICCHDGSEPDFGQVLSKIACSLVVAPFIGPVRHYTVLQKRIIMPWIIKGRTVPSVQYTVQTGLGTLLSFSRRFEIEMARDIENLKPFIFAAMVKQSHELQFIFQNGFSPRNFRANFQARATLSNRSPDWKIIQWAVA